MNPTNITHSILLVDDDKAFRTLTGQLLEDQGYSVTACSGGAEGLEKLKEKHFDLVLSDLMMEGMSGLEFLGKIKAAYPQKMVLMITGYASIESAIQAMKQGAYDYVTKPVSNEELLLKVKKALEEKRRQDELVWLRGQVTSQYSFENIIGKSPAMQKVFSLVRQVADSNTTVLLTGETGTGKELVAKAIHFNSSRKDKPFVAVNCAALPQTLLESELFGHEKGAFSGAIKQKAGRFELANGGTLLLDEVGDIPLETQVKLLRVLEEREFERIGGTETIQTDIRIISATNKNLMEEIEKGNFRQDLFFRLNVLPIHLPPLRERLEDIPLLVDSFIRHFSKEKNRQVESISPAAMNMLLGYHWPGNVRELLNVMERAVLLARDKQIEIDNLMFQQNSKELSLIQQAVSAGMTEQQLLSIYAKEVLREAGGNKKKACEILGINFKTLQSRLAD